MKKNNAYIGVDIGGTNLRASLVDGKGGILKSLRTPVRIDLGPDRAFEKLLAQCRELVEAAGEFGLKAGGVGLGVAGKIDPAAGTVVFSPNLPALNGFPLGRELGEKLGIPVVMENDANAFGLGESWAGAARDLDNWVGITLGTGTGGCLFLGGKLWEGAGLGFCAEIGHMIILPDGPPCGCGSRGCLESFASASALMRGAREICPAGGSYADVLRGLTERNELSAASIYSAARSGDAASKKLFETMGWALGIGLSNIFSLLGIDRAVIGGGVSSAWDAFIGPLRASLEKSASMFDAQRAVVVRGSLGDDAAQIGAARLAESSVG
ncbi:MAG: ROK family protein [Desulfobacteraceae bacterium]|nr:ROK family protein [Desulfobacteraceae bacterium]